VELVGENSARTLWATPKGSGEDMYRRGRGGRCQGVDITQLLTSCFRSSQRNDLDVVYQDDKELGKFERRTDGVGVGGFLCGRPVGRTRSSRGDIYRGGMAHVISCSGPTK
jgi:hypothetical protein